MTSLMPLSTVSMLFGSSSSTSTLTSLATGTSSSGTTTADVGTIKTALVNAEKNEDKQLKQVAKDPEVVRDLARYAKVVKSAKTIDDVPERSDRPQGADDCRWRRGGCRQGRPREEGDAV